MPFVKGVSGNPKGRPKDDAMERLNEAIKAAEQTEGKSLFVHFVEQAYKDKQVLIAVMKKKIADLASTDINTGEGGEILIKIKGSKGGEKT